MPTLLLQALDFILGFLHVALIAINVFGWIWQPMIFFQRILIFLTISSWVGLGFFFGIGYCPLTDWHWQIKEQLGYKELPNDFISYLLSFYLGVDAHETFATVLIIVGLFFGFFMNIKSTQKQ